MGRAADVSVFEFGAFVLDADERRLEGPDGTQRLTGRPLELLVYMLERPDRLLSKDALMAGIWRDVVVDESSLSQAIAALRRALGETGRDRKHIETVPGAGYRFLGPVRRRGTGAPTASPGPSIAVLPFEDLSAGGDQGYLADGVAEEILDRFAQIPGLRSIGRASSFVFRGRAERVQRIGEELGAGHLLTGAVRREGDRVRVSAQLIEAASGAQLFSETFDRRLDDIFAVQEEIAAAVARAVRLNMADALPHTGGSDDAVANELYLRGRAAFRAGGAERVTRAAELHREALSRDPDFMLAWVGLAQAARAMLVFAPQFAEEARVTLVQAADRALALGPDFWGTALADAWRCSIVRDWRGMERAVERAKSLAPGTPPDVSFVHGAFCSQVGRASEAASSMRIASRDDPLAMLTSAILQMFLLDIGHVEESEAEYRRSLDLIGDRDVAEHVALHRAWLGGDPAEIDAAAERYVAHQTVPVPVIRKVFEVRDRPEEACALLREAAATPEARFPTAQMVLAWWMASFGDAEGALDAAWRAQVEPGGGLASWLWLPALAEARRTDRFKQIVRRVGLVDYWRATGNWGDFARPVGADDFELL